MIITIYSSLTTPDFIHNRENLKRHQCKKSKKNGNFYIGGLGFREETFTRGITRDGRLVGLAPEIKGVHIALYGGLDDNNLLYNNVTTEQKRALTNELISLLHTYPKAEIRTGNVDFLNLEFWLKASQIL